MTPKKYVSQNLIYSNKPHLLIQVQVVTNFLLHAPPGEFDEARADEQGRLHVPRRDPEEDAWHASPDPWVRGRAQMTGKQSPFAHRVPPLPHNRTPGKRRVRSGISVPALPE